MVTKGERKREGEDATVFSMELGVLPFAHCCCCCWGFVGISKQREEVESMAAAAAAAGGGKSGESIEDLVVLLETRGWVRTPWGWRKPVEVPPLSSPEGADAGDRSSKLFFFPFFTLLLLLSLS